LEELENIENIVNVHDKRIQEGTITDQDLQGKHSSLNGATNMEVEETGSVSNSDQDGSIKGMWTVRIRKHQLPRS
jgi:hypothetical protein